MTAALDKFKHMVLAFNTYQDLKAIAIAQELEFETDLDTSNEAKRILGSIHFQKGRYRDSAEYWQDLVHTSNKPEDWLSVVTSTTLAKDFEKADTFFDRALQLFNAKTREGEITAPGVGQSRISAPYLCHYYCLALCEAGAPERASKTFFRLGEIYKRVKNTDDHFLLSRGIPFFSEYLELADKVIKASPRLTQWTRYLEELGLALDDTGRSGIDNLKKKLLKP